MLNPYTPTSSKSIHYFMHIILTGIINYNVTHVCLVGVIKFLTYPYYNPQKYLFLWTFRTSNT